VDRDINSRSACGSGEVSKATNWPGDTNKRGGKKFMRNAKKKIREREGTVGAAEERRVLTFVGGDNAGGPGFMQGDHVGEGKQRNRGRREKKMGKRRRKNRGSEEGKTNRGGETNKEENGLGRLGMNPDHSNTKKIRKSQRARIVYSEKEK